MARKKKYNALAGSAFFYIALQCLLYRLNPRSSSVFYDLLCGLPCIPLVVSTWFSREKTYVWAKIVTTVSALLVSFSPVILPHKAVILLDIVCFFALACCLAVSRFASRKVGWNAITWLLELCYLGLVFVCCVEDYRFVDLWIPFLPLSLAVGVLVSTVVMAKWLWKGSRFWGRIGYFVLCCFLATALCASCILHANYALDFSEPEEYILVIEDKDCDHHRKSPNSYEFTFSVDGQSFDLEVAYAEYRTYAVGDTYRVLRYAGAFGEPFYISGEYLQ